MRQINLTRGLITMVDDDDYDFLSQWKWQAHGARGIMYARRTVYDRVTKKTSQIHMHRLILKLNDKSILVDHRDRNPLNNTKLNLRTCSVGDNNCNTNSRKNKTSQYLGVYWCKREKKWHCSLRKNGKIIFVKAFKSEIDAAMSYNENAIKAHGEYANLNKI